MSSKMTKIQKDKVTQFRNVVGANCTEKAAMDCLRDCDWNIEAALDTWYNGFSRAYASGATSGARVDPGAIEKLFQKYQEPGHDAILADGIGRLCDDLQVDPSDIVMLVLSWRLKADIMCKYTRDEFVKGMEALGCDSIDKLKARLADLRAELKNERAFREIYLYSFGFAREEGQKILQLDTALGMWELLFRDRPWPYLDQWLSFIREKHNKAISKDTWAQFYDFTTKVKPDFSDYDADGGAWPYLLDEFVDVMRGQL